MSEKLTTVKVPERYVHALRAEASKRSPKPTLQSLLADVLRTGLRVKKIEVDAQGESR